MSQLDTDSDGNVEMPRLTGYFPEESVKVKKRKRAGDVVIDRLGDKYNDDDSDTSIPLSQLGEGEEEEEEEAEERDESTDGDVPNRVFYKNKNNIPDSNTNRFVQSSYRQQGNCFKCGKAGHWARYCPF